VNAKRLYQRWQAALEARQTDIRRQLRRKRPLTGAEVHALRVALRRARLLVELGAKQVRKSEARRFRAVARAMLDALDTVRDCDVALAALQSGGTTATPGRRLAARRSRLWAAAQRHLKTEALGQCAPPDSGKADPRKLARRLRKQTDEISAACLDTVKRAPEIPLAELHELRRRVRRWRYLRELEIAPRQIRRDRRLKMLIEVQEALGAMQNTEVILEQLQPLGRTKELQKLRSALRATFTRLHREALQQIKRLPSLA
jgi:CHAD domain-containing protein